jgi:uncharacterized protein
MKVTGSATVRAPIEKVWTSLNDPDLLRRTIPGCEGLEPIGPDAYRMTVTAGVAAIKGSYLGEVRLTDPQPPTAFTLRANGSGGPGTVDAAVRVQLADAGDGTTTVTYDADAMVGGAVGGVGQRVLSGVAKRMAGEFFKAVDADLAGVPAAAVPAELPAGATTTASTVAAPGARPVTPLLREALPAVALGAAIALLGVWLGSRLARRR